jgi:hypothetical protein
MYSETCDVRAATRVTAGRSTSAMPRQGWKLVWQKTGEYSPDNLPHNAHGPPAYALVSTALNGAAPRRCRGSPKGFSPAEIGT